MGQWIAPTLNPEELDKRISELKTVQFWLEQNAKLLAATIQALEVQRMTLATLQGMNLPLAEIGEALKIKPEPAASPAPTPAPARAKSARKAPAAAAAPAAVDPMQWWGALTQQFTELATQAMKDSATDTAKNLAGSLVKSSVGTAVAARTGACAGTGCRCRGACGHRRAAQAHALSRKKNRSPAPRP
jgi:hypothetical protein